jgi:hypothetical protein
MSKQLIRVVLGGSFAVLAGCALQVKSDTNSALIRSVQCHSYDWAGSFRNNSPLRGTIANPVNEARLRSAISARFESLGIHKVDKDADCLVGYGIGSRSTVEGAYPVGWGWGAGYGYRRGWAGGWGWGPGWGGPWGWDDGPYVYTQGIIGVDVYDAKSKQALWHASVNQDLRDATGPKAEKKIDDAVTAIFAKYPR